MKSRAMPPVVRWCVQANCAAGGGFDEASADCGGVAAGPSELPHEGCAYAPSGTTGRFQPERSGAMKNPPWSQSSGRREFIKRGASNRIDAFGTIETACAGSTDY